jgi:TolB-like protein/tetratricopeptide (TPR) repeat protein
VSSRPSFFAELRRRNVLRAGVLYAGAAWAFGQGLSQFSPALGLPDWTTRWFLIACAIGFPFWIAFAWFYEITPGGIKRESEIAPADSIAHLTGRKLDFWIIGILAVAVVLLLTNTFVWHKGAGLQGGTDAPTVPEDSIAVLPFVNRSADRSQDYFSDGISEDMLNLLAKVPKLKVISRSSSFSFKGKNVPLNQIAQTLGVAYILEGSVQLAGRTLRISAQLVDARRDRTVWSQSWDRDHTLGDVFKIQDEIAGAVVGQLKLKLLGKAQAIDPDAYATYLQARQLVQQSTLAGWAQAIPLLQQVLVAAPDYAPAWEQLETIYVNQALFGQRSIPEGLRLSQEAIDKELAADPDYASAYADLGYNEMVFTGDLAAAARHFERALTLDPGDAGILDNASGLAEILGRLDLAIALDKAQLARNPVSVMGYRNLGTYYFYARRPDDAIASYLTALRLSPDATSTHASLGLALLQKGDAEAALAAAQKETDEGSRMLALAVIYHALGRQEESERILAEMIAKGEKEGSYYIAEVLAYRNEAGRAFAWLDKAQQYRDPGLADIVVDPLLDNLRKDPRWLPLLRKLGKAPEQLDKIRFNVPLPAAADSARGKS